jgi:hypothetical protein
MNRCLALLVVFFSLVLAANAQFYSNTVVSFPYGAPVVTTPTAVLPGPATADLAISAGATPILMSPEAGYNWISAYSVGASNATFPNNAGATNSTYGSSLYQPPYATMAYVAAPPVPGVFNTGAALYTSVSYTDLRSLGQVAAELKSRPKPPTHVYTNADISRLQTPQQGTQQSPNPPQR